MTSNITASGILKLKIAAIASIVLISTIISSTVSAQDKGQYKSFEHWYLGLSLGTTKFYGDISSRSNAFSKPLNKDRNLMFGLSLTKKVNGIFWIRANLLTGNLSSSNSDLDLYFKSDIVEFSGTAFINIIEILFGADPQRPYNFYAYAGGGILGFSSWKRSILSDTLVDSEGVGRNKAIALALPLGFGAEYRVNGIFTITGEVSLRNIRTDRLDAHTSIGVSQEGYGFIGIGLHYQFDMPEGIIKRNTRHTGRSTDPALKAYNKQKANIMKTEGYRQGMKTKRQVEREKKEWLIFRLFKKTRLDMATE